MALLRLNPAGTTRPAVVLVVKVLLAGPSPSKSEYFIVATVANVAYRWCRFAKVRFMDAGKDSCDVRKVARGSFWMLGLTPDCLMI